jgi:hypothetical protein
MKNHLRGQSVTSNPSTIAKENTMQAETAGASPAESAKPKPELTLVPTKGKTKGKGSKEITYNQLSRVPDSIDEFNKVTGTASMPELCEYLFVGYNEKSYSEAADEIGEFVDDSWHKDVQTQFRAAVRGMAKLFGGTKPIEEIAAMMTPGAVQANINKLAEIEKAKLESAKPAEAAK